MKWFLIILLFPLSLKGQQVIDTTVFALNSYLFTTPNNHYPAVNLNKLSLIDPSTASGVVNVMDFGATGDGVTLDDNAIAAAFAAVPNNGMVYFPPLKTFLVHTLKTSSLDKNIFVWCYASTIKMQDLARYSAIEINFPANSYTDTLIWLGGIFDGNQFNQIWIDNPHGGVYDDSLNTVESHGQFINISWAALALFKDVSCINTVVDGVAMTNCYWAVACNSTAANGAPLFFGTAGDQGTYFKSTRSGLKYSYFINLNCDGGSIAIHTSYPTNLAIPHETVTVVDNCIVNNQVQNSIHIEDCYKAFVHNSYVGCDTGLQYRGSIHLSNKTGITSVDKCQFVNARVNFNNASSSVIGVVSNSSFISTFVVPSSTFQYFVFNGTHVVNSSFSGKTQNDLTQVDYSRKSSYTNYGSVFAINAAKIVDSCSFSNASKAVSLASGGRVIGCTFSGITTPNSNSSHQASDEIPFSSKIVLKDNNNNSIGEILCQ